MTSAKPATAPRIEHRSGRAALLTTPAGRIAAIAVGAAFIAAMVLSPAVQLVPGIPLTFQILAIALVAFLFDGRTAFAATALYVLLGALGLPVFAGFRSGIAVLTGPTGGYLLGFILAAGLMGFLATKAHAPLRAGRVPLAIGILVAAGLAGVALIHVVGALGLMTLGGMAPAKAVASTTVFLPFDLAKIVVAALVAAPVLRAFRRQLLRPGRAA
ncbi:biotin transporter BioY [Falsarthrobacter nasiphocae]|uniref:Biotin transporter n=1 Tax=Falsarthrobacter nasiphocae TaxID=189863 RepID=A0AAE3YFE1_9MICC|nr:biotin transporter BioY [Falsarthrobacter nasiphocae]MDR6891139.1 biotin transport system substrate-specific component [Falsarthrobacter nasiphocae]